MKNIVCLISGRGSNLLALLETQQRERWPQTLDARMAGVISNRADAAGLQHAQAHGVPTEVLSHRDYPDRTAFDQALIQRIDAYAPDLIVLAGFMRILTPAFTDHYLGRMINIHPSLLPAFTGLDTHARALQAGVRIHGTTVHYVSSDLDAGPIIAQAAVAVEPDDTEQSLAARVLAEEHRLLPRCVQWLLQGRVRLAQGRALVDGLGGQDLWVRA